MEAAALVAGLLLPWLLGIAVLLVLGGARSPLGAPGDVAWLCGAGCIAGLFLLTLWMRVLSQMGIAFGVGAIAAPLLLVTIVAAGIAWRAQQGRLLAAAGSAARALVAPPGIGGALRVLWWAALGWLTLRYALLAVEVALRPLYPWDAWVQWATKARVWFETARIVPFARMQEWLAAGGAVYFDASPEYPPTMPLLQVWSCVLLGRWDDALMNWPWWQLAVALPLAVYGALQRAGTGALAALAGAFLVATLPLANVHVALAGYADLPMAAVYTTAALALLRWSATRGSGDAAVALLFAVACTQIKAPGSVWALTLVPGVVATLAPRHGRVLAAAGFAIALLLLAVLTQREATILNYHLRLDFEPSWAALAESFFVLGNWHLLWYAAPAAALLAGRRLLAPPLAPLTMVIAAGILFLAVVYSYSNARDWVENQTSINRAALHFAPLVAVYTVLAFRAFAGRWRARGPRAPAAAG